MTLDEHVALFIVLKSSSGFVVFEIHVLLLRLEIHEQFLLHGWVTRDSIGVALVDFG